MTDVHVFQNRPAASNSHLNTCWDMIPELFVKFHEQRNRQAGDEDKASCMEGSLVRRTRKAMRHRESATQKARRY